MPKARALMNVPATANRVMVPRLQNKEEDCNQTCWCYIAGQQTSLNASLRQQAPRSPCSAAERAACPLLQADH